MLSLNPLWNSQIARTFYSPVSNDEGEEKLPKQNEHDEETVHFPTRAGIHTRKKLRRLTYTLIALSSALLAAFIVLFWVQRSEMALYKTPVPHISLERTVFHADPVFGAPSTPENDAQWMSLLGPGMGFISIDDPKRYHLKQGVLTSTGSQNFGVSAFHQLHCLDMIRGIYWGILSGTQDLTAYHQNADRSFGAKVNHTAHCFDYIRQGIMCAGDMSVEWAAEEGGKEIDGLNTPHHQCKSWSAIREFMDANLPAEGEHMIGG